MSIVRIIDQEPRISTVPQLESAGQIETQYQPLRFQHQVAGIVSTRCGRLGIRESQSKRMLADVSLNPETDLRLRFMRKADHVEVAVEYGESSSELEACSRCELEQREKIRCDHNARSEPKGRGVRSQVE